MLHSEACERNKGPILEALRPWLAPGVRVLEVGSGSGQHAVHVCAHLAVHWQPTERPEHLADLRERCALAASGTGPGQLAPPRELDVGRPEQWPPGPFGAVFSANTAHIMAWETVLELLAGCTRVLEPGGLLLLYGPFSDGGHQTSPSNIAFDAHLRSLDPAMGVRDASLLVREAATVGLAAAADLAMPANNRLLIFRRHPPRSGDPAPEAP